MVYTLKCSPLQQQQLLLLNYFFVSVVVVVAAAAGVVFVVVVVVVFGVGEVVAAAAVYYLSDPYVVRVCRARGIEYVDFLWNSCMTDFHIVIFVNSTTAISIYCKLIGFMLHGLRIFPSRYKRKDFRLQY
jgi:hypothetical protein